MTVADYLYLALVVAWLGWIAVYWRLAWQHGRSALKIFFPIALFFGTWPAETARTRRIIQLAALALTVITAVAALNGIPHAI